MAKIVLHVSLDTKQALEGLQDLKEKVGNLNGKKIDLGIDSKQVNALASLTRAISQLANTRLKVEAAAKREQAANQKSSEEAKKAAQSVNYLTTSAAKYDAEIKAAEKSSKRFSEALKSQIQAEQATNQATKGLASTQNVIDRAIQESEAASRAFSDQLRQQMMAEEQARAAHVGMASSMNVIDRAIQESEKASKAFSEQLRKQMEAEAQTTSETEKSSSAFSVLNVALGNIAARAFHVVINKITQAFRESLATMKQVDSELANIQKVTDETDSVIARIGDTAYETASKYGIAANEYLEAAGVFAKAGYDNYTTMAELATKTQLVGDVTAEVASKFLLSADAAWKFNGNMESLSQVLDKANTIENNYATSIEKLAQGLPLVASTAAMAGMSVDETLAALGTITAKTQESGTMAARALRALILNILKDTQTEIEEGVTWSENEIKSLDSLLWKYASEAMETARQTGGVVNPMEAIRALHDAYEEGLLTQKDLTDLAMDLGGKLRTNQLLALITNLETFDEMLGKTANSAGSADKEIGVMLGTWESKVNILKNTWTDFVADFVDTQAIKDVVDALTSVVGWFDSLIDKTTSQDVAQSIESIDEEMARLEEKAGSLTHFEQVRLDYLREQKKELQEQQRLLAEQELNKVLGTGTRGDSFAGFTGYRMDVEAVANIQKSISSAMEEAVKGEEAYRTALQGIVSEYEGLYVAVENARNAGVELTDEQAQFAREYEKVNTAANATSEEIENLYNGQLRLTTQADKDIYELWKKGLEETNQQAEDLSTETANAATSAAEFASTVATIDMSGTVSQSKAIAEYLSSAAASLASLGGGGGDEKYAIGPGMATGGVAPGGRTLVNELGPELINDHGRTFIANGGRPAVVNLRRGAVVVNARDTRNAMRGGGMPGSGMAQIDAYSGSNPLAVLGSVFAGGVASTVTPPAPPTTWSGSGSGSGASKPNVEQLAKELSDLLSNLDKQAKLAENQGDYARQAEIYEQAQEAIKKMVDDYRAAGYADDSNEILDLLNKNYDYANKQLTIYQTKWDELIAALDADTSAQEVANKLAEKQRAVEDARAALANAQKQRTVRIYNSATGQWEWVADDAKVQSAQKALTTAESNYTDTVKSEAIAELKRLKETATDLTEVVLGPALSTVAMMAESTAEFQNFARALNAVYGVGSFLGSTEGSDKVISTTDSHDTVYSFGPISLSSEEAQSMTVAQLAQQLRVLGLTS